MPKVPEGHRFEIVPDWVCEILSPTTASKDREIKLPLYGYHGVAYTWLVDPHRHTLEAYGREDGHWRLLAQAADTASIAVPPFDALVLELGNLWD